MTLMDSTFVEQVIHFLFSHRMSKLLGLLLPSFQEKLLIFKLVIKKNKKLVHWAQCFTPLWNYFVGCFPKLIFINLKRKL